MLQRYYSIHIDVDSPLTLAKYYGINLKSYSQKDLDSFYDRALTRACDFFEQLGIKATFFVVGSEIQSSVNIKNSIRLVASRSHELANHTYTHALGLNQMASDEIRLEIRKCNEVIQSITSKIPAGFRAPGYSIDTNVINLLEDEGIHYDSSSAWPLLKIILNMNLFFSKLIFRKTSAKSIFGETNTTLQLNPYYPDISNWKKINRTARRIIELPLPTSLRILPYYSTFHFSNPDFLADFLLKRSDNDYLVYLFHINDFVSFTEDNIPEELALHPFISIPIEKKLSYLNKIICELSSKRENILSEEYITTKLWRN